MPTKGVVQPMGYSMLRWVGVTVLAITLSAIGLRVCAQQERTPARTGTVELNAVLNAWVQNSARIKTLSAKLIRRDNRHLLHAPEFSYDIRWKDSGKAAIELDAVRKDDKPELVWRIVWTGEEILQYLHPAFGDQPIEWTDDEIDHFAEVRGIVQKSWWFRFVRDQFDLLLPAVGDPKDFDPLPFFIGMKEAVAKKRFQFELVKDADPDRFVVSATPLNPARRSLYDRVLITLDREWNLPVAVEYQRGRRGRDSRKYTLITIKLNQPIDDDSFVRQKPKRAISNSQAAKTGSGRRTGQG